MSNICYCTLLYLLLLGYYIHQTKKKYIVLQCVCRVASQDWLSPQTRVRARTLPVRCDAYVRVQYGVWWARVLRAAFAETLVRETLRGANSGGQIGLSRE